MTDAYVQIAPILLPREHVERIEQHRATYAALRAGVPISTSWALADMLRLGLDDLQEELVERGREPGALRAQVSHDGVGCFFAAPSPPRGSRWAPRNGKPAHGFMRLPATRLPAALVNDLADTLKHFREAAPGLVVSRAALVRETLARAIARLDAQREMHDALARLSQTSPIPPMTSVIKLAVPIPARGRRPKVASRRPSKRRAARKRSTRTRARRSTRARGRDDPDPPSAHARDRASGRAS